MDALTINALPDFLPTDTVNDWLLRVNTKKQQKGFSDRARALLNLLMRGLQLKQIKVRTFKDFEKETQIKVAE